MYSVASLSPSKRQQAEGEAGKSKPAALVGQGWTALTYGLLSLSCAVNYTSVSMEEWAEVLHAGSNTHQNFPFCVVACTSWPQRSVDKEEEWFHISVFLFLKFLWKILCSTSLSVQALGNYRQVGEERTPQNQSVGDCFLHFPWLALVFFYKLSFGKCVECSWDMSWTPSIGVSDWDNYMRAERNFSEPCSGAKGLLGSRFSALLLMELGVEERSQ